MSAVAERDRGEPGEKILRQALHAARDVFGPELSAAFALGSLAHGGFAPLVSDVDLMLVLDRVDARTQARVDQVHQRVRESAAEQELAKRLSIFWCDWAGVHDGVGSIGRLPEVDRVDLLDSGRLLDGTDQRAGARRPDRETVVRQAVEFALRMFDSHYLDRLHSPATLVSAGARAATKAVLFPVRFLYTLATGEIGQNEAAVRWFTAEREHAALPEAAFAWRLGGITDTGQAEALLARHLLPLYTMFVREHVDALRASGEDALAAQLATWGERAARGGSGQFSAG